MIVANPITFHRPSGSLITGELRMGGRIFELDRGGGIKRTIYEGVPMANAFDVGPDGKLYVPAQAANEIWRIDLAGSLMDRIPSHRRSSRDFNKRRKQQRPRRPSDMKGGELGYIG